MLAALVFLTGSCGNFFEESSQDEIKPSTVEDMASVLYASAYPLNFESDNYLPLLTDEVQCNGLTNETYSTRWTAGQPVFCFNKDMAEGNLSFVDDENSWKNYYQLIMGCNVVLDNTNDMTGSDDKKNELIGQARLLRAYYYLRLAMIYCQPYDTDPDTNLGLTLIETSKVKDTKPSRTTVRKTYDFIESELLKAAEELKDFKPSTVYRVTPEVAYILLSRLYLYEENWDKCIEYASLAIDKGPALTNLNNLSEGTGIYEASGSSEVVWNYGGKQYVSTYIDATNLFDGMMPYSLSQKSTNLYDVTNDLRYKHYLQVLSYSGNYVTKVSFGAQYDGEHGVRMSEAYLNRAEAYARKAVAGDASSLEKSLADINLLRQNRYVTGSDFQIKDSSADDLLSKVLQERRRELVWEDGFRWMDIKRNHLSVQHVFIDQDGNKVNYELKKDDPLYALPIPRDAISRNPNLQQNPR